MIAALPIVGITLPIPDALTQTAEGFRHPERGGIGVENELRGFGMQILSTKKREFPNFDSRKSIFVSDVATMGELTFSAVMEQLATQSGTTKETLFAQWWDTVANKKSGTASGPHCDDEGPASSDGLAPRNGFPLRCPRPEAGQPDPFANPTSADGYSAIAYSNRFNLADPKGTDCGEYRVVFARNSGKLSTTNRNLIIFEALVPNPAPTPNPTPENAHDGCRPILEFWLSLSNPNMSSKTRGEQLRDFFLKGLPADKVGAAIDVANFTAATGQIRTNQFMKQPMSGAGFEWTLREFRIERTDASMRIVPSTAKSNPGADLFLAGSGDPRAADFIAQVVAQLDELRGKGDESSALKFTYNNADRFNSFESNENERLPHLGDVLERFRAKPNGALEIELTQALKKAGSRLSAENIVRRIRTQTCAGCHQFSRNDLGIGTSRPWPGPMPSTGFTHQSERTQDLEDGPDGAKTRFGISPLLTELLIPHRADNMLAFLKRF